MLTIYKSCNKQITEENELSDGVWVNVINPDETEIEFLVNNLNIDRSDILSVLDAEEPSRFETEENYSLIIVDLPVVTIRNNTEAYKTIPSAIFLFPTLNVTVSLKDNDVLRQFTENRVKNIDTQNPVRFGLQLLSRSIAQYLTFLRQIDKQSDDIEERVNRTSKNKELVKLLYLEKSLIYFSTSLSSNQIILDKFHHFELVQKNPELTAYLDDMLIESKQAIEMTNTYREVLSGIMDFFASMISNNLNIVMKFLTSITLIFVIPTLVASIYGMNVPLPFQGFRYAFPILMGSSLLISLLVAYLMKKRDLL